MYHKRLALCFLAIFAAIGLTGLAHQFESPRLALAILIGGVGSAVSGAVVTTIKMAWNE